MEVKATAKRIGTGARKARRYGDLVRGQSVEQARGMLSVQPSPAARALLKCLNSAIANAENNHGLDGADLRIASLMVDEGLKMPRMRARARGRGERYYRRTCHITVVVSDEQPEKASR